MLGQVFQLLGVIASLVTIYWFGLQIWERRASRLIVQVWWELALDPVQRKRFRKDINVGLNHCDSQLRELGWFRDLATRSTPWTEDVAERVRRRLVEPAFPLSIRHTGGDGIWAMRLLVYNPSFREIRPDEIESISIRFVARPRSIAALTWQANDGRIEVLGTESDFDAGEVESTIRLPRALGPHRKLRDELPVVFNSRLLSRPPEVNVDPRTHLKSKVKLYKPARSRLAALVRYLARLVISWVPSSSSERR